MSTLQRFIIAEITEHFSLSDEQASRIHVQPEPRGAFTITLDHPELYRWPTDYIENTGALRGARRAEVSSTVLRVTPVRSEEI